MSYQVLARKWRPRSFAEMAGQEHVLQALINALDNNRLHHSYLFTGTRGVGKTTIARILSKCLNCEEGISSVPCGVCASCTEINEGRFIDLIEVDAASRTGVDDMRDLLDNVQYAPSRGRYKIYLIDEVHMLSKSSFAALLKTLEEPPPHVKFLFATTDPQKLPITVLSRCLQFNLKNLSAERITQHLQFVLGEEQVPFEGAGLWSLARAADGSMRDALSLTDQAIGHGGGQVNEAEVSSMLGTIERGYVVDICNALSTGTGTDVLAAVARMAEQAPDYDLALADVLSIWHQVAILQAVPEALDKGVSHYSALLALAGAVSREDAQLFYQICLLGRKDLHLAPDLKSGFEMIMLRALAFRPLPPNKTIAADPAAPQEAEPAVKKSETVAPSETPRPKAVLQAVGNNAAVAIEPADNPVETPTEVPQAEQELSANKEPSAPPKQEHSVDKVPLQRFNPSNWIDIRKQLSIGASLGEIASHCLYRGREGSQLNFLIDSDETSLYDTAHQQSLSEALSAYFEQPVTVDIVFGVAEQETPRAANIREKSERLAEALETLNNDADVIKFKTVFDGTLDEQSVRPID
ncbi:MAG: DNA polymerase III subunit gamma/tau [Porticoccaceae bacterium]|nr:DNA polymerase III subunit gamma/tau [Porticoccaceae bacterium]